MSIYMCLVLTLNFEIRVSLFTIVSGVFPAIFSMSFLMLLQLIWSSKFHLALVTGIRINRFVLFGFWAVFKVSLKYVFGLKDVQAFDTRPIIVITIKLNFLTGFFLSIFFIFLFYISITELLMTFFLPRIQKIKSSLFAV